MCCSVWMCCSAGYESVGLQSVDARRLYGQVWPIQPMFGDVLHDAVRHEIPDRLASPDAVSTVGGADGQSRDHLQCHPILGQPVVAQDMPGPGHPDEVGEVPELVDVLPRQDLGQRIGAGDEEQLRVRTLCVQVTQGVDGVGRAGPVQVDAADVEARVGGCGNNRHQISVLGRRHHGRVLLPGLTRGHEQDLIEVEERLNLSGSHEVAVMDGIEGPTHDTYAPGQRCAPGSVRPCESRESSESPWSTLTGASYLAAVFRKDHNTPRNDRKVAKTMAPEAHGGIGSSRSFSVPAGASVATVGMNDMDTA